MIITLENGSKLSTKALWRRFLNAPNGMRTRTNFQVSVGNCPPQRLFSENPARIKILLGLLQRGVSKFKLNLFVQCELKYLGIWTRLNPSEHLWTSLNNSLQQTICSLTTWDTTRVNNRTKHTKHLQDIMPEFRWFENTHHTDHTSVTWRTKITLCINHEMTLTVIWP